MMSAMRFLIALQAGVLAVVGVSAAPARYTVRDAVAPPITFPTADTVWTGGQQSHVDWDTSSLPPYKNITNTEGMIILGYEDDCDPNGGEHLDLDHPLAKGFNITLGTIPITVPDVKPRSDYILVLLGNSGNASPKFTINAKKPVRIHSSSGAPPPARLACSPSSTSTTFTSSTSVDITTSAASTSVETTASTSDTEAPATTALASETVGSVQSTSPLASSVFNTASSSSTATTTPTALAASSSSSTTVTQSAPGSTPTSGAAQLSATWAAMLIALGTVLMLAF